MKVSTLITWGLIIWAGSKLFEQTASGSSSASPGAGGCSLLDNAWDMPDWLTAIPTKKVTAPLVVANR